MYVCMHITKYIYNLSHHSFLDHLALCPFLRRPTSLRLRSWPACRTRACSPWTAGRPSSWPASWGWGLPAATVCWSRWPRRRRWGTSGSGGCPGRCLRLKVHMRCDFFLSKVQITDVDFSGIESEINKCSEGNNDRPTNQPTTTDRPGHRKVSLPIINHLLSLTFLQDLPIRSRCQHLAFSQHHFRHHRRWEMLHTIKLFGKHNI